MFLVGSAFLGVLTALYQNNELKSSFVIEAGPQQSSLRDGCAPLASTQVDIWWAQQLMMGVPSLGACKREDTGEVYSKGFYAARGSTIFFRLPADSTGPLPVS
jgi:hypothetical protein